MVANSSIGYFIIIAAIGSEDRYRTRCNARHTAAPQALFRRMLRATKVTPAAMDKKHKAAAEAVVSTTEKGAGKKHARSIYPFLLGIPMALQPLSLVPAALVYVKLPSMNESVRLIATWQYFQIWASPGPLLLLLWFVSSMLDGALNGIEREPYWPRAQVFNLITAWVLAVLHVLFVMTRASPIMLPNGTTLPQENRLFWIACLVAAMVMPFLIHHVFAHLRVSLVKREESKKGAMKYIVGMVPAYGAVALLQLCTVVAIDVHSVTLPVCPNHPSFFALTSGGVCERMVNTSYMRTYCTEAQTSLIFLGVTDSRGLLGLPEIECDDDLRSYGKGPFRSLFDACHNAAIGVEISQSAMFIICGAFLFLSLIFREYISSIDDEMNAWNWIERARNWEANTKTSRGAAAWSYPRIVTAIVLAATGFIGTIVLGVAMMVILVMRYRHKPGTVVVYVYSTVLVVTLASWLLAFGLLVFQFRHRKLYKFEPSEPEKADEKRVNEKIEDERRRGVCTFYFLKADYIRSHIGHTLPRFQELQKREGVLKEKEISHEDAYFQRSLIGKFLAISHRWLEKEQPDKSGEQLRKLKEHLKSHPEIEWVWYDYYCMPQHDTKGSDDRTPAQKAEFKWMLEHMHMLYLGASVLLMVDRSYMSRFWTQFEAWLSMQKCTKEGLLPDSEQSRCTIMPTMGSDSSLADEVRSMWKARNPQQAHDYLELDDVCYVTNEKDKTLFLPKLLEMSKGVEEFYRLRDGDGVVHEVTVEDVNA